METQTQVQASKLDNNKLKEITNGSNTSVVTMLYLALRQRARNESNVTTTRDQLIRMGEKVVDEDYEKFWKSLEEAGIGSFIVGRRGNPDRFKWNYSLKNVARLAIEGKEEQIKELSKLKEASKPKAPVKRRRKSKPALALVANEEPKQKRKLGRPRKSSTINRTDGVLFAIQLKNGIAQVIMPKNSSNADLQAVCQALLA